MANDLKLAVKSLGYAYNLKITAVSGAVLVVFCIMIILFGNFETNLYFYGIYFMEIVGIFPIQLLYSLNASNMVLASSRRKRLQTSVPAVLSFASMASCYLVSAVILGLKVLLRPEMNAVAGGLLLSSAVFVVTIMLYMSIAYKYFVFSTVLFLFAFVGLLNASRWGTNWAYTFQPEGMKISYPFAIILGLTAIAAGAVLQYLLSLLVYKVPVSKQAQAASLRKEMS